MRADPFTMQERPAVQIFLLQPVPEETLMPVLWGLEEEGIPAETQEAPNGTTEAIAKQAADGSPLNVGIGINGMKGEVVLHHRDLPGDSPLFSFGAEEINPSVLRILGVNAARLVKGNPLLFQDTSLPDKPIDNPNQSPQGELESLIARVLMEILEKR
jgi:hypothetical protein